MTLEELGNLGEAIGAVGVIFSLVYLAIQIRQQNKIAKAQFGNSLTQRLYDRYFQTSKDAEYAEFMAWIGIPMTSQKWMFGVYKWLC